MKYKLINDNFKTDYGRQLLSWRGVEDIDLFLNPTSTCLQNPDRLENIKQASDLFLSIIQKNGNILIVVDSDCDGYTSAAIIYQYIKDLNTNIGIDYILHEGKQHGLEDHIEDILEKGMVYDLIILPDSSSNDINYHEQLKDIKLPCLVLDHHITDEDISTNAIVVNNQLSPNYKNKELTGAGMTYQFCKYIDSIKNTNYAEKYIDLAALGIVGDMGSMLSLENRYIVKKGFENINNFFFKSFLDKQSFSTKGKINPTTVAFYVVPLINAMIRVGTMEEKKRLFEAFIDGTRKVVSGKRGAKGTLEYLAIESVRECTNARSRQNRLLDEITARLEHKIYKHDLLDNKILFIRLDDDDEFPSELNGLCAMRMSVKYKKPTIIARLGKDGYNKGSIRGLSQSELKSFKNFLESSKMFDFVAGHDNAAGCSIFNKNLEPFHLWANKELENVDFGEDVYDVNFVRAAAEKDIENLIIDLAQYENIWG